MSKTKFNVLHKHSITINGTKYRVLQSKDSNVCSKCDGYGRHKHCISDLNVSCTDTIGTFGYLKRIKHGKDKI